MRALKSFVSFVSTCARALGPVSLAVALLVPFMLALCYWWFAGPLSVWAWIVVAIGSLLLVPIFLVVGLALQVTVFAPDWVERYPSGQVRARGPHYHGDRQDHWTFWHGDGWKECEGEYDKGFENGTWTFYHPNGRPCTRGELDGWRRQGAWEFWDEAGCPLDEAAFLARYPGAGAGRFPSRVDEAVEGESGRDEDDREGGEHDQEGSGEHR